MNLKFAVDAWFPHAGPHLDFMHPHELRYPAIFHDGQAYYLERSDCHTASYFGGPFEGAITGVRHGPRRLHHIASLNGDCFEALWQVIGGGTLRLLYGMCMEGCRLKYRSSSSGIEVMEMEPTTSSPDWPYPDYPTYLPYFPLRLERQVACSLEEFSQVSCQPLSLAPSQAVVLVPPIPAMGMSLWGPSGDAECVQIVFRCDLVARTVDAYNQCG